MADKEYMVFFKDLSEKIVKAENILLALQSIRSVENVIRVSLHEKAKIAISSQVVDDDFISQDEFRPAAGL
jgi:hypothetical protein